MDVAEQEHNDVSDVGKVGGEKQTRAQGESSSASPPMTQIHPLSAFTKERREQVRGDATQFHSNRLFVTRLANNWPRR